MSDKPKHTNHVEDFANLPWCQELLNSADYTDITGDLPPPPSPPMVTNDLFTKVLPSPTGLRAWCWLISRPHAPFDRSMTPDEINAAVPRAQDLQSAGAAALYPEAVMVLSLGSDLSGYRDVLHGGLFGLLVDQIGGVCGRYTLRDSFMTAEITLRFKKSIPLPTVVLCRARTTKLEGRKLWMEASLEDGKGGVYCTADTFWIIIPDDKFLSKM